MRIPNIFFNTKSNFKYSYYELGLNNKKGSYLEISIDENTATIEIDRYSSIPIYYIIFKDCLYASTKIDSLVNSAPSDFKLEISSLGISTFIKTNTLMDNLTFFNNIKKIPYGCKLVFNKKKKSTKIFKHWNLEINCNNQNDDKNLLNYNEILHYSLNKYLEKEKDKKIGLNLSGGYDSRMLLGYLSKFNPKIFSYNFTGSPEINIVKKLSKNLELDLEVFQNLNFYSKYEEQIFTNTDYMMSLLHGHCFPTILKQKKTVNAVFYGHFIDMHSQSHQYNSFFFNEKNKKKIKNKLFDLWCNNKSVFSIIDLNIFDFLVKKKNVENYKDFIEKQLDAYSGFDGNYQYDINYFVHHGLRRAMAQSQLGANFLEFYTPALHADFFDFVWSIPHEIRKKRNFQIKLLKKFFSYIAENDFILDNYKINYSGTNYLKKILYKSKIILKHKRIAILKPFYDIWGDKVPNLFKQELSLIYKSDIKNNEALLDLNIFNNDNLMKFLNCEKKSENISLIFAIYTVSKFIKKYFT
jgi:hypothetical protein